ncbi:MAG: Crp/Fnr family transcriptional regulator [Synechococcaceae cyanobacterium SM2_3_1]|nr:Crp/Fnr family transcriptional regulator [Synechococcaceae cyanobacterium SM2_3_1]
MSAAEFATIADPLDYLTESTYLFRGFSQGWLGDYLSPDDLVSETYFPNRPIYTAFEPDRVLSVLYLLVAGGPVIIRSSPLDRIIGITYPGACFGMRNLPFSHGVIKFAFPSPVEAYKRTHVLKVPEASLQRLYKASSEFQQRYDLLFELREKFEYHLLNCSSYPPQAVAALLRALVYQERSLGAQPNAEGVYEFDLPIDIISRACHLNRRTVEQVLKGMAQVGLIQTTSQTSEGSDTVQVLDPESLKGIYAATREKVDWWPLR